MLLNYKIDWESLTDSPIFQALRELNVIDELELRNVKIREDYRELRNRYNTSHALEILMKKYSISDMTIRTIIYHPKSKSNNPPLIFK